MRVFISLQFLQSMIKESSTCSTALPMRTGQEERLLRKLELKPTEKASIPVVVLAKHDSVNSVVGNEQMYVTE